MALYNIICVKDQRQYQNWIWGISALECKDRDRKEPYKLYEGDMVKCSLCDNEVLVLRKEPKIQEGNTGWEEALEAFYLKEKKDPKKTLRFY